MAEEMFRFVWKGRMAEDCAALRFHFAPTRSRIVRVAAASPAVIEQSSRVDELGATLSFERPVPRDTAIEVELNYVGEPPVLLLPADGSLVEDYVPENESHFRSILANRAKLAFSELLDGDGRQAFFYDLDRLTHPTFVAYCDEMTPDQRQRRKLLVERVGQRLKNRLKQRPSGTLSAPPAEADLLAITDIFQACARMLRVGPPDKQLGDVLLEFAAGDLGRRVTFTDRGDTYVVTEPDSASIFLFAELGVAAHPFAQEFWTLALLRDLVQMQRYYLARFRGPLRLEEYARPIRLLDPEARRAIDDEYAAMPNPVSLDAIEQLIHDNLARITPG